jgi:hypothetical protein
VVSVARTPPSRAPKAATSSEAEFATAMRSGGPTSDSRPDPPRAP